jgi:hypothetical protein
MEMQPQGEKQDRSTFCLSQLELQVKTKITPPMKIKRDKLEKDLKIYCIPLA